MEPVIHGLRLGLEAEGEGPAGRSGHVTAGDEDAAPAGAVDQERHSESPLSCFYPASGETDCAG